MSSLMVLWSRSTFPLLHFQIWNAGPASLNGSIILVLGNECQSRQGTLLRFEIATVIAEIAPVAQRLDYWAWAYEYRNMSEDLDTICLDTYTVHCSALRHSLTAYGARRWWHTLSLSGIQACRQSSLWSPTKALDLIDSEFQQEKGCCTKFLNTTSHILSYHANQRRTAEKKL